jgi:hypothetical protein
MASIDPMQNYVERCVAEIVLGEQTQWRDEADGEPRISIKKGIDSTMPAS